MMGYLIHLLYMTFSCAYNKFIGRKLIWPIKLARIFNEVPIYVYQNIFENICCIYNTQELYIKCCVYIKHTIFLHNLYT